MYRWMVALCACVAVVSAWLAATDSQPTTTLGMGPFVGAGGPATALRPETATHAAEPSPAADAVKTHGARTPKRSGYIDDSLDRQRIVAYYGVAGNPQLGVVGTASAEHVAEAVIRRARSYRGYGEAVRPAIELVATMAQTSPGHNHTYSTSVPAATIRRYVKVAHRHDMLLILDLQPGHATFLSQAKALQPFLLNPNVGLGLDTEWRVTSGAPGGGRVGRTSAREINSVGKYVSGLATAHRLPQKLLLIHQFRLSMLPNRYGIVQWNNTRVLLNDDGFGTPSEKIKAYQRLKFPHSAFGIGFKVFLHHESHRMTPRQVMALRPRPDLVNYQ